MLPQCPFQLNENLIIATPPHSGPIHLASVQDPKVLTSTQHLSSTQQAIMCKEKHTNLACGCTEFSGILNCPLLFKGCMGPRGEQDRVYEVTDQPCDLCNRNGWKPNDKGKAKDASSESKAGASDRNDPEQRPAKRKRMHD